MTKTMKVESDVTRKPSESNNNHNNKNINDNNVNVNVAKKLQSREICSKFHRTFASTTIAYRFRNMHLRHQYDTYDPFENSFSPLPFIMRRAKVVTIVAVKNLVFVVYQSGLIAAFCRETNKTICFLNVFPHEVIDQIFYNKNDDSIITVSVYALLSYKCRSIKLEYIRMGKPDLGFPLFQSESLKWPGSVEFDNLNDKVLTYSAEDSIYKVFDLKDYTMLYSISDSHVQDIKIGLGTMLVIFNRTSDHVPLKIISIEDGRVLKTFNHLLHQNKKVDFIEIFNEKLLVKQENENLQILDVRNAEVKEISRTEFTTPSTFNFLYENQLFLTFRNGTVYVWNMCGEIVTQFEDHQLWHPDWNTNNTCITRDQNLIISYFKKDSDYPWMEAGSINVSDILTGKCVAKINATSCSVEADECISGGCNCNKQSHSSLIRSSVTEALKEVTALFYDEDRNEILIGNKHGIVYVWSN